MFADRVCGNKLYVWVTSIACSLLEVVIFQV